MINLELQKDEFLAIRINQPFNDCYIVNFKASFLLDRAYSKAADFDGKTIVGSQRRITKKRLSDIKGFIESEEASFPNSIIVAANYDKNDVLVDEDKRWFATPINESLGLYKIKIPSDDKVCSVVDGQHRLFAFENTSVDMELNCTVFLDLIPSLQASVFATVNFNQAPVDKSVAYNLFGYQLDRVEEKYWSPDLLGVNLCRYFSETEGSFFYGHINYRLANRNVKRGKWVISTASFVDGIIGLISGNPKEDRYKINKKELLSLAGRKSIDDDFKFSLRDAYKNGNDAVIKQVISEFFSAVRIVFDITDESDSILTKTVGIKALFLLLNDIVLEHGNLDRDLLDSFQSLLEKAKDLPLSDSVFFTSTTTGQKRLMVCLKVKVLGYDIVSLLSNKEEAQDYASILS
ncbi:DGQHR domain-containing protein [Vibrio lentus]